MDDEDLEAGIAQWRAHLSSRRSIGTDAGELESHLRDRIEQLRESGLAPDEAFLIAVKRMGEADALSAEFAREHSDRLWKQLLPPASEASTRPTGLLVVIGLTILAAVVVKLPQLFASRSDILIGGVGADAAVNGVILVLAVLGAFHCVTTRQRGGTIVAVGVAFAIVALALNLYPFDTGGMTWPLAVVHAPILLWLTTGVLYVAGDWRSGRARMDFIRFSGEWFVYYVLIALGGAVLVALTMALFTSAGLDPSSFVEDWLIPCGAAGAVIVSAWLVEAKQAVIENIAPVLTRVFTPLFTVLLVALVFVGALQGSLVESDRDILILFDVTLLVVLGLLLYSMSARDALAAPGWFDRLQIVLLASALVVDVFVLVAMLSRIGAFGLTANKAASLGLNVILLANLVWATWLQVRFVAGRTPFSVLERWQTSYVPVYVAWTAVVVIVFPPLFRYA